MIFNKQTRLCVSLSEEDSVLTAVRSLAEDFGRVFGQNAEICYSDSLQQSSCESTVLLHIGSRSEFFAHWKLPRPEGPESFLIQERDRVLFLGGRDRRGAIYAIYHFAEHYLGIDPLYYWTDQDFKLRDSIRIYSPVSIQMPSPCYKKRGWFLNDEDLLVGWGRDRTGQSAIDLRLWKVIFETILRCKGNMVIPGTFLFADEPQIRLAGRMGLIISQHHCEILGTNNFRWPKDQPYSYVQAPELLENAWQNSVISYGDQEIIWTVGYRGLQDNPFWWENPSSASTMEERGRLLTEVIARQIAIVRKFRANPRFIWNAWDEGVDLLESGYLQLPSEVTIVWPDNRSAMLRDRGKVTAGQGAYIHPAFYDGTANHLTEWVPVNRFVAELDRFTQGGATEYLLLNVSCIRPVLLSTKALMEYAHAPWPPASTPHQSSGLDPFYSRWLALQFGVGLSSALCAYFSLYYQAPARFGGAPGEVLADQAYQTMSSALCTRLLHNEVDKLPIGHPLWLYGSSDMRALLRRIILETGYAIPRWEHLHHMLKSLDPEVAGNRKNFFCAFIRAQLSLNRDGNLMLNAVARIALQAVGEKQRETDEVALCTAALAAAERIRLALRSSESGKWQDFFAYSFFSNFQHSISLLRMLQAKLSGEEIPDIALVHHRSYEAYEALSYYQKGRYVQTAPIREYSHIMENSERFGNLPPEGFCEQVADMRKEYKNFGNSQNSG